MMDKEISESERKCSTHRDNRIQLQVGHPLLLLNQ